jgi:ATP-dependent Lhr-like helicase
VRYVILDEIHAALGSKRGCYLSCQIDRLALVAGEFQRIALSATINPPEAAADFAGGLRRTGVYYEKRKMRIVAPNDKKEMELKVAFPNKDENDKQDSALDTSAEVARYGRRYVELVKFIIDGIKAGACGQQSAEKRTIPAGKRTILVFTDSRRRAERLNFLLNQAAEADPDFAGRPLSYCHHGSLSKEVRREVENALAAGEISCVVATGSLELGIDIGGVDEVILAGSPGAAAVALQRLGRSGHGVGMTSRGWLVPFHGVDLLQAAAVAGAVEEKELEETSCIENPLDLLSQLILSLVAEKERNEDDLFQTLRGFYVYRNLSKANYEGVVRMLAGAYEGSRLRELKRQIFRDDETKTLWPAPGTLLQLYTSGGVITGRG